MADLSAEQHLQVAESHLREVREAWSEPTDWNDLGLYGFYCLEAAISAAAQHAGQRLQRNHPAKARMAEMLTSQNGLPDATHLLRNLDSARKAVAYGDTEFPEMEAKDIAVQIEEYVASVREFLKT